MSSKSQGRIWPYAIVISILLIIAASAWTVYVAIQHPVEMSDMDMQNYHHYDANANDIISAKIAFDNKYTLTYHSHSFDQSNAVVSYLLVDKSGRPVNDAKMNIIVTRPDNHKNDLPLDQPKVENGVYTFEVGALPLAGRWNILTRIVAGNDERYFNLKVDTRNNGAFEY